MKTTKELIGQVAVDSGQLMVCDPCYIDSQWEKEEFDSGVKYNFSYNACCNATLSNNRAGQLNFKKGYIGLAVAFSSGYGDGIYDVYAHKNEDGVIVKVEIELV